jgi:hypothetical protein
MACAYTFRGSVESALRQSSTATESRSRCAIFAFKKCAQPKCASTSAMRAFSFTRVRPAFSAGRTSSRAAPDRSPSSFPSGTYREKSSALEASHAKVELIQIHGKALDNETTVSLRDVSLTNLPERKVHRCSQSHNPFNSLLAHHLRNNRDIPACSDHSCPSRSPPYDCRRNFRTRNHSRSCRPAFRLS